MKKLMLLSLLIPLVSTAQEREHLDKESGYFQLGIRNTISAFSRVNTDWFADYITTDIAGIARRSDLHIGWSVLAYPLNYETTKGKLTPYILAGHCFDYTKVSKNNSNFYRDKWSSAVQAGLGAHYNITDRMDISLTAQYMMHLGYDVHAEVFDFEGHKDVLIEKERNRGVEGHLLVNLSMNVRLFDMWDQHKARKRTV
jgi:hypothetical protein